MRRPFGAKRVRSCSRCSVSTAANHGKDEGCVEPGSPRDATPFRSMARRRGRREDKASRSAGGTLPKHNSLQLLPQGNVDQHPSGAKRIDELAVGDLVTTIDGSARPIQFISVNSYRKSDPTKPWVADARPVLVRKSALSENVPNRDLYLTPTHSLYLDGVLIPVHNLINGSTIVVDPAEHLSELDYFHIKLESHDVVLAEGTPCETLLMVSESAKNFADYYRAYGFPLEEQPYAPIPSYNGGRSEIGSRLRSAMSIVKEIRRPLDIKGSFGGKSGLSRLTEFCSTHSRT